MMTSLLLLTFGLAPAGAGTMDLVRESFTARHGRLSLVRGRLRKEAPGGSKFVIACLEVANAYAEKWEKDDRRIRLIQMLIEVNAETARWPALKQPETRARIRALVTPLLDEVATRRAAKSWAHIDEIARFLTHFDLWGPEHVPFLSEELIHGTRRWPLLLDKLIALFPEAPESVRASIAASLGDAARPRFALAALSWLYGPPLAVGPTLMAWAKWEVGGRSFATAEPTRGWMRDLGARFESELRTRAALDPTLKDELSRLSEMEIDIGGLSADDRARVAEAVARVLAPPTSPCTDSLASRKSP